MHAVTGTGTTVMHLVLDPAPPLKRVAEVTDLLRSAALSHLRRPAGGSMLAGRTAAGDVMRGQHQHAHWLPVTDRRVIAGVCLWCPAGLTAAEAAAVAAVRFLAAGRMPGGPFPLTRVSVLPGGRPLPARLAGPSATWRTVTPFAAVRRDDRDPGKTRPSRSGHGFLRAQVAAELTRRGFPAPVAVEGRPAPCGWQAQRPSGRGPVPRLHLLDVTFGAPVTGPLAIGALSHFGLGLMVPAQVNG